MPGLSPARDFPRPPFHFRQPTARRSAAAATCRSRRLSLPSPSPLCVSGFRQRRRPERGSGQGGRGSLACDCGRREGRKGGGATTARCCACHLAAEVCSRREGEGGRRGASAGRVGEGGRGRGCCPGRGRGPAPPAKPEEEAADWEAQRAKAGTWAPSSEQGPGRRRAKGMLPCRRKERRAPLPIPLPQMQSPGKGAAVGESLLQRGKGGHELGRRGGGAACPQAPSSFPALPPSPQSERHRLVSVLSLPLHPPLRSRFQGGGDLPRGAPRRWPAAVRGGVCLGARALCRLLPFGARALLLCFGAGCLLPWPSAGAPAPDSLARPRGAAPFSPPPETVTVDAPPSSLLPQVLKRHAPARPERD